MPSSPVAGQPVVRLGRYEILKRLAVGGMAEIFVARSRGLEGFEKIVVLKRIHPALAENPQFVQMFLDEARIAATLQHPNIVQVHDIENIDGGYLFSMEYLHGADLHQIGLKLRQRGHHWPLDVAVGVMLSVTAGLHYAHEKLDPQGRPLGIVHRDVSPQNVLVTYDGVVKLVDFGIAKARGRFAETKGAALKGKVQYMSPEQCRSAPVDRRSDVFAAGILLWELTTGAKLFDRESEFASMHAVVDADVPTPRSVRPDYPRVLEPIVMKALAREPDARWPTALALHEALSEAVRVERLSTGAPTLAKFLRGAMGPEADAWNVAKRTGKSLGQHLTEQLTTDDLRSIGVEAEEEETGIRRRIGAIPVRPELLKPNTVELEPEMLAGMLLEGGEIPTTGGEVHDTPNPEEATELVSRPPPPPRASAQRAAVPPPVPSPPTLPVTAALAPASPSRPLPSQVPTTQLDAAALAHPVLPAPIVPRRPSGSGPTMSAPPPTPPPPVLPVILPPVREVMAAEPAPPMLARSTPPRAGSETMVGGRPVEQTGTGTRKVSIWRWPLRIVIALGAMGAGAVAMSALGLKERRPTPPSAAPATPAAAVPAPSTTPDAARPGPAEILTPLPPDAARAAVAPAPADAAPAAAAVVPAAPDAAKKKRHIRRDEDDEETSDDEEEEDVSAEVSEDGTSTPARAAATSPDAAPRPAAKETKKDELETLLP